ncbi:MAG: glycosyltransferase family A protein [Chitinophagaceae bacterium]
MNCSRVSVIIPTYNYAQYICEAINSVLQQNYPTEKIEIIVVDDGSTDNTKEVLKPFIDQDAIKYYYQQNKGKANATYNGIHKSTGTYIFNLDADDFFFPDKIAASVKEFEADKDIVHVATPAKIIYQETQLSKIENLPGDILGKPLDGNWLLHRLYNSNILFGGGSTYAARSSILKVLQIPDAVDMYIDEFLILAVLPFGKSFFIEQPLSAFRVHASNYSGETFPEEKQIRKRRKLLHSSAAILSYLQNNEFNDRLVKIYRLQDATRRIAFKESLDEKKTADIFQFAYEVFFRIQPKWRLIKKYKVINRLLPSHLLRSLKRIKLMWSVNK